MGHKRLVAAVEFVKDVSEGSMHRKNKKQIGDEKGDEDFRPKASNLLRVSSLFIKFFEDISRTPNENKETGPRAMKTRSRSKEIEEPLQEIKELSKIITLLAFQVFILLHTFLNGIMDVSTRW